MPREILELDVEEVSLVNVPANQYAKVMMFKAADAVTSAAELILKMDPQTFADLLAVEEAEEAVREMGYELFSKIRILQDSLASILESEATNKAKLLQQSLSEFQTAIGTDLPSVDDLTKALENMPEIPAGTSGIQPQENGKMPDLEKQVADLTNQVATLAEQNQTLTDQVSTEKAAREAAEKLAGMTDAAKGHYATLTGDAAKAFLAKSYDEQASELKKKADSDETLTYNGDVIRKSEVGAAQFNLFKGLLAQNAETEKRLASEIEKNAMTALEKRAEAELPNTPGTPAEKAVMLKGVESITDEAARKAAMAALKAADAALAKSFTSLGGDGAPHAVEGSAEAQLDAMAAQLAAKEGISKAVAYDRVTTTEEGARLYKAMREEQRVH